jgi:hypothetical protein
MMEPIAATPSCLVVVHFNPAKISTMTKQSCLIKFFSCSSLRATSFIDDASGPPIAVSAQCGFSARIKMEVLFKHPNTEGIKP